MALRSTATSKRWLRALTTLAPSPYWGDERIWDSRANVHNPMLDQDGRVWLTARIRGPQNPEFCREGSRRTPPMDAVTWHSRPPAA